MLETTITSKFYEKVKQMSPILLKGYKFLFNHNKISFTSFRKGYKLIEIGINIYLLTCFKSI